MKRWGEYSNASDRHPSAVRPDFAPVIAGYAAGSGGCSDLTKDREEQLQFRRDTLAEEPLAPLSNLKCILRDGGPGASLPALTLGVVA